MRIVLDRPRDGGPPWRYEGAVLTPTQRFGVTAVVAAGGEVSVELEGDPPRDLPLRVKTMIRAAHKHARDEAATAPPPPPRQIHRWRA